MHMRETFHYSKNETPCAFYIIRTPKLRSIASGTMIFIEDIIKLNFQMFPSLFVCISFVTLSSLGQCLAPTIIFFFHLLNIAEISNFFPSVTRVQDDFLKLKASKPTRQTIRQSTNESNNEPISQLTLLFSYGILSTIVK